MSLFRLLILIAALGFGHHLWQRHKNARLLTEPVAYSQGEFLSTAMPDGAAKNTVLILAPLNCPSSAARRADALAERLTRMGIPNVRGNSFSLRISNPTQEEKDGMTRASTVLGGEIPAVFVNGMGKANPSPDEVAEVYLRTK